VSSWKEEIGHEAIACFDEQIIGIFEGHQAGLSVTELCHRYGISDATPKSALLMKNASSRSFPGRSVGSPSGDGDRPYAVFPQCKNLSGSRLSRSKGRWIPAAVWLVLHAALPQLYRESGG